MTRYATEKQLNLITRLSAEKGLPKPELGGLTIETASALIEELFRAPRKGGVSAVGMYRNAQGEIFKVQRSSAGRFYAKKLNASGRGFTYAQGAILSLTAGDKMTLEQAREFGVLTGNCCVCGRELTDPQSVERGIGPVCGRGDFWA